MVHSKHTKSESRNPKCVVYADDATGAHICVFGACGRVAYPAANSIHWRAHIVPLIPTTLPYSYRINSWRILLSFIEKFSKRCSAKYYIVARCGVVYVCTVPVPVPVRCICAGCVWYGVRLLLLLVGSFLLI